MGIFTNKYVPHIAKEIVVGRDKTGWEIVTKDNYGFVGMIYDRFVFEINGITALSFDKNGLLGDGIISGEQVDNWNSAYIHSQSTHAPSSAEQNVQSNWAEANSTSDSYIQNKPTLATVATTGSYSDLSDTPVDAPAERIGKETLTAGATVITFSDSLPSSNYALFLYVYDSEGQIGHTVSNEIATGFTINVGVSATLNYRAVLLS